MLTYDLFSLSDEIIKAENMAEVTSSKIFIREGEPDPEGLASYEIFGYPGTEERKKRYGYIKLNDTFIHPHCVFELKSIKRHFTDAINGYGKFYIKDGELTRADEGKIPEGVEIGTGVGFLKDNWEKLTFDYKDATYGVRFNRLRFIKSLKKEQIFIDKIIVIPPFYRDIDMREGGKKNEVNSVYISILNYASTLKATSTILGTFDDVSDSYRSINQILVDFHEQMVKMYGGRKGFIHKYIMGKSVDYSARLVISCLDVSKSKVPGEMDATFEKSVLPLFAVIKCFAPFIVNGVRNIITDYLHGSEYVLRNASQSTSGNLKIERVRLASDWQQCLTSAYIYNLIELFHDSPEHRLDIFTLPTEDGGEVPVGFYVNDGGDIELETDIATASGKIQPLRLIHLFYMAAMDNVSNKHIYITRYPIEDHNNTYPSGMNIIPYAKTARTTVGDTVYEKFPVVDYENDMKIISSMFVDSLVIFPGYLSALTGDFDGDQLSVIGVFTKEANEDAKRHIWSVGNMTSINGTTSRKLGTLPEHVIHAMTY